MGALQLTLFGGFRARLGSGEAASLPGRKVQALLAYLAITLGQFHPRDKLAALLWSESSDAQARDALRHALAALRRAMPSTKPLLVLVEGPTLALNPAAVDVDVATFERRVAEGTPEALEHAAALYQGDLLSGFSLNEALFEEWLLPERERLRELALEALAKLLAHQQQTCAPERAIQTAVRLLGLDPLQEAVHRALMRLYVRQGRRGAALKQYQFCVTGLQRELGTEPESETKRLYQEILRQRPVEAEEAAAKRPRRRPRAAPYQIDLLSKDAPLFGRDADQAWLGRALEEVSRDRGQLILLVGEAGIGKTSLLGALAADAVARGARVLLGRCYESTQILPFGPWVDAFRTGQVLADQGALDLLDPVWRSELTRLFPELGAGGLPPASDNDLRLFESVARLVEQLAAGQAIVLMLEDVHWADDMSLRLLAFLARRIPSRPVLLVASSREEELADAATARRTLEELGREAQVTRVTLAPLSRPDTMDLVHSLARAGSEAGALARLEEQVWAVSEGNPFVAVETMRALQDGTIPLASTLPERVRAMIAARLDRLTESARQLAATAAVIGREFEFPLLQHASGLDETSAAEGVEELVRRRVLRGVGERFDFVHHRLQSAVYDRLLPPRRKLLHRRAGEALEALSFGDLERDPLALGLHFREGEVWDKAAGYLRAAGVDATVRSAYREAAACFEQALAITRRLPETRVKLEQEIDLRLDLRASLHAMGELDNGFEHLRDAERLARTLDDRRRLGFASMYLAHYHWLKLRLTNARSFAQTALAIGKGLPDFRLTVAASFYLGMTCAWSGDYREAGDFHEMGLRALGDDRGRERCGLMGFPAVMVRARFAETLAERGEFRRGLAHAQESLRIAEQLEHPYSLLMACHGLGFLYGAKGDLTQAVALLERGLALADRWNLPVFVPTLSIPLGHVYTLLGRSAEAISMLSSTMQRFETMYGRSAPNCMVNLGEAFLRAGRLEEALSLGGRALTAGRAHGQRGIETRGLHLIAEIAAHRDPPDVAESEKSHREALALAEQLGMQPLAAHCHLGLGELYTKTGEPEKATAELTAAAGLFRSMDMTFWLDRAENVLA